MAVLMATNLRNIFGKMCNWLAPSRVGSWHNFSIQFINFWNEKIATGSYASRLHLDHDYDYD